MQIKNLRTCIFSRQKYTKEQLIRFSIVNNEIIFLENNFRGYYLHIDKSTNIQNVCKMLLKRFKIINIDDVNLYLNNKIKTIV